MRKKLSLAQARSLCGILFVLPGFIGFVIFVLIPLCFTLYYAMMDAGGRFAVFQNMASLFESRSFWLALRNTAWYVVVGGGAAIILSFLIAWALFRLNTRNVSGTAVCRVSYLMPMALSAAVSVLFVEQLFESSGWINQTFGTSVNWLLENGAAFWILVGLYIWKNFGYYTVLFLAAFAGIAPGVFEAARMDGAGNGCLLRSIVIPQIMPSFYFIFIMSIIGAFKMYRESWLLFGEYPAETAYMFQNFINNNLGRLNYSRAACAAMVLFVLCSGMVSLIVRKIERSPV